MCAIMPIGRMSPRTKHLLNIHPNVNFLLLAWNDYELHECNLKQCAHLTPPDFIHLISWPVCPHARPQGERIRERKQHSEATWHFSCFSIASHISYISWPCFEFSLSSVSGPVAIWNEFSRGTYICGWGAHIDSVCLFVSVWEKKKRERLC